MALFEDKLIYVADFSLRKTSAGWRKLVELLINYGAIVTISPDGADFLLVPNNRTTILLDDKEDDEKTNARSRSCYSKRLVSLIKTYGDIVDPDQQLVRCGEIVILGWQWGFDCVSAGRLIVGSDAASHIIWGVTSAATTDATSWGSITNGRSRPSRSFELSNKHLSFMKNALRATLSPTTLLSVSGGPCIFLDERGGPMSFWVKAEHQFLQYDVKKGGGIMEPQVDKASTVILFRNPGEELFTRSAFEDNLVVRANLSETGQRVIASQWVKACLEQQALISENNYLIVVPETNERSPDDHSIKDQKGSILDGVNTVSGPSVGDSSRKRPRSESDGDVEDEMSELDNNEAEKHDVKRRRGRGRGERISRPEDAEWVSGYMDLMVEAFQSWYEDGDEDPMITFLEENPGRDWAGFYGRYKNEIRRRLRRLGVEC
nr:uncharacterized protein CI109_004217 [Kwoniella shandongensis]KAA5527404.1 hypothetical protein CI109_004217 [Kwoniella shandongensis]